MKWWESIKQLRQHRWLPFFLPVIGTLLYIAIAVLLVPSEFGDKPELDATDSEKPALDSKRPPPKATGRAARVKRPDVPIGASPSVPTTAPTGQ